MLSFNVVWRLVEEVRTILVLKSKFWGNLLDFFDLPFNVDQTKCFLFSKGPQHSSIIPVECYIQTIRRAQCVLNC